MAPIRLSFLDVTLIICVFLALGDVNLAAPSKEATEPSQEKPKDIPRNPILSSSQNLTGEEAISDGDGSNHFRIISREEWNARATETNFEASSQPAEYVMISEAEEHCFDPNDCAKLMRKTQNISTENGRDLMSSFYIGDDGLAYEGKGWNSDGGRSQGGLEKLSLWVTFFGKFQDELPSQTAIKTYKSLINHAISVGKLSPSYKLISFRLVYNVQTILGDALAKEIKKWCHYTEEIDLYPGQPHRTAGLFPVVFREEWNASRPTNVQAAVSMPIEYVVVANNAFRCFSTDACVKEMQDELELSRELLGDVLFNFYVGDDGLAYEGRGWDVVPFRTFEDFNRSHVIVSFIGTYDTYLPSQRAFLAFNKLLRLGVWLGKISRSYKILSYRQFDDDSVYMGDMLHQELEKIDRFSNHV